MLKFLFKIKMILTMIISIPRKGDYLVGNCGIWDSGADRKIVDVNFSSATIKKDGRKLEVVDGDRFSSLISHLRTTVPVTLPRPEGGTARHYFPYPISAKLLAKELGVETEQQMIKNKKELIKFIILS